MALSKNRAILLRNLLAPTEAYRGDPNTRTQAIGNRQQTLTNHDQPYEMLYDYYVGATKLKSKQKMPSRASPSIRNKQHLRGAPGEGV